MTRHRRSQGSLAVKTLTLSVAAACAILLWLFALPRVGEAVAAIRPPQVGVETLRAEVVSCPGSHLDRPCRVRLAAPGTAPREVDLVRTGLFDVTIGERLTVRASGGVAVVAGWRPVVDALLLLALATLFTVSAIGRWKAVLDHGDSHDLDDLDECERVRDAYGNG